MKFLVVMLALLAVAACSDKKQDPTPAATKQPVPPADKPAPPSTPTPTPPAAEPTLPGAFKIHVEEPSGARDLVVAKPVVRIGRLLSHEVVLTDEKVSRTHAMFERGPDGIMLTDMGTLDTRVNGTQVDPTKPVRLSSGDVIELGATKLTVTFD